MAVLSHSEVKKACLVRNQNEKRRRDRFNNLMTELSCALPVAGKKLSRNNVLKFAIEYFRQVQQLAATSGNINSIKLYGKWQPDFISSEEFRQTMLDGLDGVVLAVDDASKIFYVSSNVFSCLGYDRDHLLKSSILEFVHPDDQRMIYSLLTAIHKNSADKSPPQQFSCRFRFGPQNQGLKNTFATLNCVTRSFRSVDVCCIVLLGRIATVPTLNDAVVLTDSENVSKFTTRLNKLWRFECVERSTTLVMGYYPFELLGNCLYDYCHDDDLANLTEYHNMLLYSGVITTCCYRLLTKGHVWIWVRSRCHVSYSQLDSKPDSVVCVTWPMKSTEFSALNQEEVLERDRQLFSQILEKNGEKQPISSFKSANSQKTAVSSSSSSSLAPLDKQGNTELKHMIAPCEEMPLEMSTVHSSSVSIAHSSMSHTVSDNSDLLLPTSDQFLSQTVPTMWPIGIHVDSAAILAQSGDDGQFSSMDSLVSPMENVDENSLLLADYVDMPESLSMSQWALHLRLRDQYKSLTESIRQQSEQITVVQRQLAIQKELSALSDQLEVQQKLEKRNLNNSLKETRAVIHQKMKELHDCTVIL